MKSFLFLVGFFSFFYIFEIIGIRQWYCCDNLLINIPARIFQTREFLQNIFPLWNPYIFSGTPFLADINLSPLYPGNILFFFFSAFESLRITILYHLLLGMIGIYLFSLKTFKQNYSALLVSMVFGFSGTYVSYTNNLSILQVASYTPWVLWSLLLIIEKWSVNRFVMCIGILSIQILAGHPQLMFYSTFLYVSYFWWFSKLSSSKKATILVAILIIVVGITSLQIIPFIEFVFTSTRKIAGFEYATFGSFNPLWIVRLLLPAFIGDASRGTAWLQEGSMYGFFGVTTVILLFCYLNLNRATKFWLAVGCISLLLSFGKYSLVYTIFYYLVPGIGLFRVPSHFLFLTTIAASVLAGYAFERVQIGKSVRMLWSKIIMYCLSILAFICFIVSLFFASSIKEFLSSINIKLQTKLIYIGTIGLSDILIQMGLSFLFMLVIFLIFTKQFRRNTVVISIVVCTFLELVIFSRRNITTTSRNEVNEILTQSKNSASILTNQSGRIYVDPELYPAPRLKEYGLANAFEESLWQAIILRPNIGMLFNIPAIDGYSSLVFSNYAKFVQNKSIDPTGIQISLNDRSFLSYLGLKSYLVSLQNQHISSDPLFEPLSVTNTYTIFSSVDSRPLIYAIGENGIREIIPQNKNVNEVRLKVHANSTEQIIYNVSGYPGWRVQLDGREVPVEMYQGLFPSCTIVQGEHELRFFFLPKSVVIGAWISVVSINFVFILLVTNILRKK